MSTYSFGSGLPTWNGVPMVGGFPQGLTNVFFVDYTVGSDGVNKKANSLTRPFKTIEKALSTVTTNKNEGIALVGNASHVVTSMLDFSKNRVHMFGYDPAGRFYGQNAKVSMGVTTAATDIGTILNTGVRNSFRNIKFTNANTVAQGIYCFVEGGEYTVLEGCEIYKETDLNETTASELVMNGDSAQVINCTIGSLANLQVGNIIRAGVRVTAGIAGAGKVARDVLFKGCNFWKSAGGVTGAHVYGANAADVERIMTFDDCTFVNAKTATAVPAQCVAFGNALTVGQVLMKNCVSINNTKLSTTTGVLITGAVPTYATSGIAVQS